MILDFCYCIVFKQQYCILVFYTFVYQLVVRRRRKLLRSFRLDRGRFRITSVMFFLSNYFKHEIYYLPYFKLKDDKRYKVLLH